MASLPTDTLPQARSAVLMEHSVSLTRAAVYLNTTHYLTAEDLSAVLGLSCTVTAEGVATLSAPGLELSLTRNSSAARLNGAEVNLDHVPFVQSGDLLLPLEDLAQLLELEVSQDGTVLTLSKSVQTTPTEVPAPAFEETELTA